MKRYTPFILLALVVLPVTANAFSLDDVVRQWMAYMRQKVATLEQENEELRAQIARYEEDGNCEEITTLSQDDASEDIQHQIARWDTIVAEIKLGKYAPMRNSRGELVSNVDKFGRTTTDLDTAVECSYVDGCPWKPLPSELTELLKRLYKDGTFNRGLSPQEQLTFTPHVIGTHIQEMLLKEIALEQARLREQL
jgi:hypothetical protein